MADDPCSIVGCHRPRRTREWCSTHYERWRVHGDPMHETWQRRTACSIDGCPKPHAYAGYCAMHYTRKQRFGDPLAAVRYRGSYEPGAICTVEGCDSPREKREWCLKHYTRWQNHGDPLIVRLDRTRKFRATPQQRRKAKETRYARQRAAVCVHGERCVTKAKLREVRQQACFYCGADGGYADHFEPLARGGLHCLDNLVPACGMCNMRKNDADPWEWWSREFEGMAV